jgi:hypothetical protein
MQPTPPPFTPGHLPGAVMHRGGPVPGPQQQPPPEQHLMRGAIPSVQLEAQLERTSSKSPGMRVLRTVLQVLVGVAAAVPSAVALLPLSAAEAAWPIGIAGVFVIIASAVQNGLDDVRGRS